MKKVLLYIGILALVLNIVVGLLLSTYPLFNIVLNSMVIVITTLLIWLSSGNRNAFSISLTFLYLFIGILQLVLGVLSPASVMDNWMIVTIIALFVLECMLLIITKTISRKVK